MQYIHNEGLIRNILSIYTSNYDYCHLCKICCDYEYNRVIKITNNEMVTCIDHSKNINDFLFYTCNSRNIRICSKCNPISIQVIGQIGYCYCTNCIIKTESEDVDLTEVRKRKRNSIDDDY